MRLLAGPNLSFTFNRKSRLDITHTVSVQTANVSNIFLWASSIGRRNVWPQPHDDDEYNETAQLLI